MADASADLSMARGIATAVLLPVRFMTDGWALWTLWRWFVVPLGIVPLAFWQAVGLDTLAGMFIAVGITYTEPDPQKRFEGFIGRCLVAPLAVLVGWVALLLWRHL